MRAFRKICGVLGAVVAAYVLLKAWATILSGPTVAKVPMKHPEKVFTNLTADVIEQFRGSFIEFEPFRPQPGVAISRQDVLRARLSVATSTLKVRRVKRVIVEGTDQISVTFYVQKHGQDAEITFSKTATGWVRGISSQDPAD